MKTLVYFWNNQTEQRYFFINFLVYWLKKRKDQIFTPVTYFLFEYVWIKIRKIKKNPKKLGNSYRDNFLFCHTGAIFCYFCIYAEILNICIFCKERFNLTRKESTKVRNYRRRIFKIKIFFSQTCCFLSSYFVYVRLCV